MKNSKVLSLSVAFVTCVTAFHANAQVSLPKSGLSSAVQTKLAATTFVMESTEAWCTVSPITHDGYLLTALHCVRDCLMQAGAGEEGGAATFGLVDLFVVRRSTNVGVVCANQSIPALGAKGVTVVATGRALSGFSADFFNAFTPLYSELQSRGWQSRGNDFALLKIETKKTLSCLPLETANLSGGSPVWGVGFPQPASEKEKLTLQASPGQVYGSASESQFYKAAPVSERAYVDALYNDSTVLYSNAFSRFGQSGGPIVNDKGALVGVISGYSTADVAPKTTIHEMVGARASAISGQLPPAVVQASGLCR